MLNRRPPLRVLIAAPRGFCAGVDRAIQIVELALEKFGAPVYVRHEIVHNRFVVDRLRDLGAVFVDELDEVPDDRPVVFSAHGVPKAVPAAALDRGLAFVDATCPLVSKVHRQAERLIAEGRHIIFVGHAGHPEVIGTFGQVPEGSMTLVETVDQVSDLEIPDPPTSPSSPKPRCRSTTPPHRRRAEGALPGDPRAAQRGHLLRHLQPPGGGQGDRRRVRPDAGDRRAQQQQFAAARRSRRTAGRSVTADRARADIDWDWLGQPATLGITAGASAPELLVREVVDALRQRFDVTEEETDHSPERMIFKLPRELVA